MCYALYPSSSLSVSIPTYILGPTEKQEISYFSSVSLENGGEICENLTYLGKYATASVTVTKEMCLLNNNYLRSGLNRLTGINFLPGRKGILKTQSGLKIAYLSGVEKSEAPEV